MPSLGADMERGKLVEWLVKPGSSVHKGDVIAVVETHKGAFEIDIFEEGVISELCAGEGEEVPVGGMLAQIVRSGEAPAIGPTLEPDRPAAPAAAEEAPGLPLPSEQVPRAAPAPEHRVPIPAPPPERPPPVTRYKITPAARRRAAELRLDLLTIMGTGIDGSVTLADIEAAALKAAGTSPVQPSHPRRGFDPTQMRQAIAAAMSRSKREIPHYYLGRTIDMGASLAWLERFNGERSPDQRLLPAVLLLKASALALREVPQLNGFWEDDRFRSGSGIHIGWAVSLRGGGLISPAIHDVDTTPLPQLMLALRDLVGRARGGGLRSSEMTDASFTITSLGERGADFAMGIIYPPQVATLGFGRIVEHPWVVDGQVTARPVVMSSLAADHRASDGHTGALFLAALDRWLQGPEEL